MKNGKEVLAWRRYPEPEGTEYFREDVDNYDKLLEIFDFCQILEASILPGGWAYIFSNLEIEQLIKRAKESGWFDEITNEEVLGSLMSMAMDSGYNPKY